MTGVAKLVNHISKDSNHLILRPASKGPVFSVSQAEARQFNGCFQPVFGQWMPPMELPLGDLRQLIEAATANKN
jgi:hypothetical protein